MAVIAQLPKEKGGAEGRVAVIDTEGTWRPERIVQISERFGSKIHPLHSYPHTANIPQSTPKQPTRTFSMSVRRIVRTSMINFVAWPSRSRRANTDSSSSTAS